MRIPSEDIPQADTIEDVVRTVFAISQGARTYQQIATAIGKVGRQGRYYRRAAEILGFTYRPKRNNSILTDLGQQFLNSGLSIQNPIFIQAVLNARVIQRTIPYLELNKINGVTQDDIVDFLISIADISGDSMAPRRFSSVVSWLESLQMVTNRHNRYFISSSHINSSIEILEFTEFDEPILPTTTNLNEYREVEQRAANASQEIMFFRNGAAHERADNAHRRLVNLVSRRLKEVGAIPRFNQFIDLAARVNDLDFIFEMKSTTADNAKSQIRRGISQLYEYRYLQNSPTAYLILVVENPLPQEINWMLDYMEVDRNIHLVWDGDNNLHARPETRQKLPFL